MKRMSSTVVALCVVLCLLSGVALAAEKTVLRVRVNNNPTEMELFQQMAQLFMQRNPNVDVQLELNTAPGSEDKRWEKFAVEALAGSGPDVMFAESRAVMMYAHNGFLLDLTPYITRSNYSFADFFPLTVEEFKYQNRYYGLPHSFGACAIGYNMDMFDAAGAVFDRDGWDWDDFLAVSKKVIKDTDGDGVLEVCAFELNQFWSWVWGAGGEFLSSDMSRSTVNTPEALLGLSTWVSYETEHKVTGKGGSNEFAAQKSAMLKSAGPYVANRLQDVPFRWHVALYPSGPVRRAHRIYTDGWVINARTKQPELAWEFIKFFVSPEALIIQARGGRSIPALRQVAADYVSQDPSGRIGQWLKAIDFGHLQPLSIHYYETQNTYKKYLDQARAGKISVQEAAIQIDREINAILAGK